MILPWLVGLATLFLAMGPALAQEASDLGRIVYRGHCASCHGSEGRGDGPMAEFLSTQVPDLSALQKNNGGVFPFSRVYATIEAGGEGSVHAASAMPAWSERLVTDALILHGIEIDPARRESFVRGRILAVIDHLAQLQRE